MALPNNEFVIDANFCAFCKGAVRVTTDTASDPAARNYADVTNVSVQIFGEVEETVSTKEKETEPSGPFGGKSQTIPGKVEMERYYKGSPGTAYKDNDPKN